MLSYCLASYLVQVLRSSSPVLQQHLLQSLVASVVYYSVRYVAWAFATRVAICQTSICVKFHAYPPLFRSPRRGSLTTVNNYRATPRWRRGMGTGSWCLRQERRYVRMIVPIIGVYPVTSKILMRTTIQQIIPRNPSERHSSRVAPPSRPWTTPRTSLRTPKV
jgi:hypothetical protein